MSTRALIDLRMVRGRLHGIARYALELARRLPRFLPPGWELEALTGPDGLPAGLGPLRPDLPIVKTGATFLSAFEQPLLAATLTRAAPDLFHATSFSLPALWNGRLVATLHDANHLALAEEYGAGRVVYYRVVVGPRARRAQALIAPSAFARDELAARLELDPYRIQVIGQGVAEHFRPAGDAEVDRLREKYRLPPRYLLAVGNPKPFKNLRLLAGIAAGLPAPLVLLAGPGAARELGFPEGTIELGGVDEDELPPLYSGARALLLPSRYEGFGLPALEAMACGCPVIAAQGSALTEVVGEAGLLVPADSPDRWREELQRLLRDEALRARLIDRGLERAARWSWDDCARKTAAVYERAIQKRGQATF